MANDRTVTAMNDSVIALNDRLAFTERRFLNPSGLPGRKYWKSVLQAPGRYTGME